MTVAQQHVFARREVEALQRVGGRDRQDKRHPALRRRHNATSAKSAIARRRHEGPIGGQRILSGMGGQIEVDSQVGRGSTFRVTLAGASGHVDHVALEQVAAPVVAVPRSRLLIIDDDAAVGAALKLVLSDEHEVRVDTSARRALERLSGGERYDVILCDLMMPELSGMDFHSELANVDAAASAASHLSDRRGFHAECARVSGSRSQSTLEQAVQLAAAARADRSPADGLSSVSRRSSEELFLGTTLLTVFVPPCCMRGWSESE